MDLVAALTYRGVRWPALRTSDATVLGTVNWKVALSVATVLPPPWVAAQRGQGRRVRAAAAGGQQDRDGEHCRERAKRS